MSLDEILSDIIPTNKSLKDKMRFAKQYKCPKCGYTFTKIMASTFIKTSMPQCPSCGGNEIRIDDKIEKKKDK